MFSVHFQRIGGDSEMGYTPREWPTKAMNDRDEVYTLAEDSLPKVRSIVHAMEQRKPIDLGDLYNTLQEMQWRWERTARILERQGAKTLLNHERPRC